MKPEPRRHIIFDFDGPIGDTYLLNWELVRVLHPEVPEEGYRIRHHLGNVFADPVVPFTAQTAAMYWRLYNERLTRSHVEAAIAPLRILSRNFALHVVSSNCEGAITRALTEAGIMEAFGHILGKEADTSKVVKFQRLAESEGFSLSEEAIFVTDTLGDILEANKVDLPTLAVTFGYHPRDILARGNPAGIVDDWEGVLQFIERIMPAHAHN